MSYQKAQLEVIHFAAEDIITTSNLNNGDVTSIATAIASTQPITTSHITITSI